MAHINLLPWRAQLREERKQEFLAILGGSLIITLLVLFIVHGVMSAKLAYQNNRNLYLEHQMKLLDTQITELKGMQKQKEELIARMNIIQELQANRLLVVHLFDDLVRILPEGVYLTSIKREGQQISFQGRAQTNTRVSTFMRNLENSQWYTQPMLKELKQEGKQASFVNSFVLQVSQKMPQPEGAKPNAKGN